MPVTINGSTGVIGPDGTAISPVFRGSNSNSGIYYTSTGNVAFAVNGTQRMLLDSTGTINANTVNAASIQINGTSISTGVNVQTFSASGTWTKPSGYGANSRVYLQTWAGGGGGGKDSTGFGAGGGGGGYNERWITLSSMGATETVTIGSGGALRTTNGNGNPGGNTSVGSLITAYGGGGGGVAGSGGGGGGQLSMGVGNVQGEPFLGNAGRGTLNDACNGYDNASGFWHGGGGGGSPGSGTRGGRNSVFGGGGGGYATGNTNPGISSFGGSGGAGGTTGTAGTQPGGGGGGSSSGNSGAGGDGRAIVTIFYGV